MVIAAVWVVCAIIIFLVHADTHRQMLPKEPEVDYGPAVFASILGPIGLLIVLAFWTGARAD